jgi:hypothetical protein
MVLALRTGLPRLLSHLPRGLTSIGTSRLLPILYAMVVVELGNGMNKVLICGEIFFRMSRYGSSRCTVVGEKAGRQTAMYSAPSGSGVL